MTGRKTIEQAPSGENSSLTGTEKVPISGNQYTLISTIAAYIRTLTQTLTGKTINLTDNTLTGTKAQFNTAMSDADFATLTGSETLTNKTLTAPVIADFTAAQHDHGDADDGGTIAESVITFTDITTNNSSTTKHGYLKKLDNDSAHFMDGTGAWSTPVVAGAVATDAIWDAKGDLAGGTGANTAAKLTVGTNGFVLTADSAETTGMKWATGGAGDFVGPGSSTDNAVVRFDSTTGKLGQNSVMTVSDAGTVNIPSAQTYNINNVPHTHELDYVEFTSSVSPTATTEGTANTVVTSNSVAYDGATVVVIEFVSPLARPATDAIGRTQSFWLYEDAGSIGKIGEQTTPAASSAAVPIRLARRMTPTNASHVYSIRASVSAGTALIQGGAGGTGNYMPGFIRITRA